MHLPRCGLYLVGFLSSTLALGFDSGQLIIFVPARNFLSYNGMIQSQPNKGPILFLPGPYSPMRQDILLCSDNRKLGQSYSIDPTGKKVYESVIQITFRKQDVWSTKKV